MKDIKKRDPAANNSYKDQYHFRDVFLQGDDLPSLNVDPDINTSIKENPYRANVNIEKDEMVLQPDLSALFQARGKKHTGGGIDVYLNPGAFIFSDDPSLALSAKECKQFEFSKGGRYDEDEKHIPEEYTPAKVVKKNVDPKHYNRLIANLQDVKKDHLAQKSSAMMLEKYINTLGQVAYLQERKKDFPDGLPPFSAGTAPVFNAEIKDEMDQQKQYAKYGGTIDNPYLPKAQLGSLLIGKPAMQIANRNWTKAKKKPTVYSGVEPEGPYSGVAREDYPVLPIPQYPLDYGEKPIDPYEPVTSLTPTTTYMPSEIDEQPLGYKSADWEFTPWQKISQGYNALKYAGAKRYMPYRSRFDAAYMDPSLVNPEQNVQDIKAGSNQQIAALQTLSPILRNTQAASAYGQYLDKVPGVRSQYDNQNAQIINQARQFNTQIRNQESLQNMQNDQNYYRESVVGQQNFDNMKTFLADQYMNNLIGDVQTNQSLAYNLLTQNNPAYRYDFRTGRFLRNKKDIRDAYGSGGQDDLKELIKMADQVGDPVKKLELLTKIYGIRAFGPAINSQMNPFKKLGGSVNPYYNL